MEMVLNDQYIVPTIHNEPYFNKPPLFNWVQVAFFKLSGSFNEPVCRIPGLLSFILTGVFVYLLGRYIFDKRTGLFASLFYMTSADIYLYGSVNSGGVDLFLGLLIMVQIGSVLYFHKRDRFLLLFITSYIFTALGFLSKGLPSVVAQFITLVVLGIYGKCFRKLLSYKHLIGILIFLLITAGYFIIYSRNADPLSLLINFVTESGKRFSSSNGIADILMQLIYLPQRLLVSLLMPWSLVLFLLMKSPVRKILAGSGNFKFFVWLFAGNTFLYFLAPDYHHRYLYPFLPFAFLILAKIYVSGMEYEYKFIRMITVILIIILSIGIFSLNFITDLSNVRFLFVKTLVIGLLFLILAVFTLKFRFNYLFGFALIMILLRFTVDLIYLPGQQDSGLLTFRATANKLVALTQNNRVYLTGEPDRFDVALEIGPLAIPGTDVTLTVPPMIPYQIPYYITKSTGKIMEYTTNLVPGNFYLARVNSLPSENIEILYQFDDNFIGYELALFRLIDTNELPVKDQVNFK